MPPRILIVDDIQLNRATLKHLLGPMDIVVDEASNGRKALELLEAADFDLILLDLMMPEIDGYEVLKRLKGNERWRDTPVLIVSAVDEIESVATCIRNGADDYLTRPFEPTILRARVSACLEKKRLRDQERRMIDELSRERDRAERLLLTILPASVAERLKSGEETIADSFEAATVLFAGLVGMSEISSGVSPTEAVHFLNNLFGKFDALTERHGVEKLETFGDIYICAAGVPAPRDDHAPAVADLALDMVRECAGACSGLDRPVSLRIGISSGPVVGGVIGKSKFSYEVWGEPVKVAGFLELYGSPGQIQVSETTRDLLEGAYLFEDRGGFFVEGAGEVQTYYLMERL